MLKDVERKKMDETCCKGTLCKDEQFLSLQALPRLQFLLLDPPEMPRAGVLP